MLVAEQKIEAQLLLRLKSEVENYITSIKNIKIKPINNNDLKNKIKIIDNKLIRLKDLYVDNLIDKDTYIKDYNKYNNELDKLNIELNNNKPKDNKLIIDKLNNILNSDFNTIYNNLTKIEKRCFWFSILDKINVESGAVVSIIFLQ